MTYEEIVKKVTQASKKIEKGKIKEHAAIEIDVEGEGEGAFYVELSEEKVTVAPYEYYDRDCRIHAGADVIMDLITGKTDAVTALSEGKLAVEGDIEKAIVLANAFKSASEKKPAEKKATVKKTTVKKRV